MPPWDDDLVGDAAAADRIGRGAGRTRRARPSGRALRVDRPRSDAYLACGFGVSVYFV